MKSYPGCILLTVDETAHACSLAPGTLRTRLSRKTFPVAHRKMGDRRCSTSRRLRNSSIAALLWGSGGGVGLGRLKRQLTVLRGLETANTGHGREVISLE
jgi:hypothetical protein